MNEQVQIYGVRSDGSEEFLGNMTVPPKMKAKDIVINYFGTIDEDAGNDAAMAYWCCLELIDWMRVNPTVFVSKVDM